MRPFESYALYHAIHLHFTSSYDCVKYNYKTRVNEKTLYKRNDRYFFAKAANRFPVREDLIRFYVSQYSDGDTKKHVSSFFSDDGEERYTFFEKKRQSFTHFFRNELSDLSLHYDSFDDLFKIESMYPPIVEKYISGELQPETLVALHKTLGILNKINISDPLLWPDKKKFLLKYSPFIDVNIDTVKKVVLSVFTS